MLCVVGIISFNEISITDILTFLLVVSSITSVIITFIRTKQNSQLCFQVSIQESVTQLNETIYPSKTISSNKYFNQKNIDKRYLVNLLLEVYSDKNQSVYIDNVILTYVPIEIDNSPYKIIITKDVWELPIERILKTNKCYNLFSISLTNNSKSNIYWEINYQTAFKIKNKFKKETGKFILPLDIEKLSFKSYSNVNQLHFWES